MTGTPRIGFDALFLEQPMTGAGQYALNLWRQLRDHQHQYQPCLLMPANVPDAVRTEADGECSSRAAPMFALAGQARKIWWEQRGLITATRMANVALTHIPYFSAPFRQRVPYIVTIHDVIPLALPAYAGSIKMRAYLQLVSRAAHRASLILTDSEYSRGDIARRLGIEPERIRVTPLAAGPEFSPARTREDHQRIERTRAKYGLRHPFILYVGGFDVRKRVPDLIRGFASALPALPGCFDLVIPGKAHTGNPAIYPPVEPIVRELGIADRIQFTGFVSHEEKIDLYRAAEVFVFPSEYEGFGLDPLEAMACGTPVVCSNRSSLLEVVGDSGLLIDPDSEHIAQALVTVLNNDQLRGDLACRSLQQSARFSWERTARLTLDAYDEILARSAA